MRKKYTTKSEVLELLSSEIISPKVYAAVFEDLFCILEYTIWFRFEHHFILVQ